jgi:hypothetical protein
MAKKRVPAAPIKRKHRVMLSFNSVDHEALEQEAQEAGLPVATYAKLLVRRQLRQRAPASQSRATR